MKLAFGTKVASRTAASLACAVLCAIALRPAARADDRSFDDPGIHFSPPLGWQKLAAPPPNGSGEAGDQPPVAVFAYDVGKPEQRAILITIEDFDGTLDAFETSHESKIHQSGDGVFIKPKKAIALANGMPGYLISVTSGAEAGKFVIRYDESFIDGQRGIVVSYVGRQGDFDETAVTSALSSLYIVRYPGSRN